MHVIKGSGACHALKPFLAFAYMVHVMSMTMHQNASGVEALAEQSLPALILQAAVEVNLHPKGSP